MSPCGRSIITRMKSRIADSHSRIIILGGGSAARQIVLVHCRGPSRPARRVFYGSLPGNGVSIDVNIVDRQTALMTSTSCKMIFFRVVGETDDVSRGDRMGLFFPREYHLAVILNPVCHLLAALEIVGIIFSSPMKIVPPAAKTIVDEVGNPCVPSRRPARAS